MDELENLSELEELCQCGRMQMAHEVEARAYQSVIDEQVAMIAGMRHNVDVLRQMLDSVFETLQPIASLTGWKVERKHDSS